MFYLNKDTLIINGISIGQYLTEAIYGYYDTWSSDAGYGTNSGKFTGTFKGTYTKITMKFRPLTPEEIILLTNSIFRVPEQTVIYDDASGVRKTITTHKGDLVLDFFALNRSTGFQYEVVANDKL